MSSGPVDSLRGGSFDDSSASPSGSSSHCRLGVARGSGVTLWHDTGVASDTDPECQVQIAPDRPAIIGRSEGRPIYYLDPSYTPTRLVPGTGQNIMHSGGGGSDLFVSRGHFMLRAAARGVLLVNGVPRRGGGLRPPRNGTLLLRPERRPMNDGEEYLIESGVTAVVGLPNGAVVRICAECGTDDVPPGMS